MGESLQELREIFSSVLEEPVEAIDEQTSPDTLRSWDSLRHVELVIAVESRYGVSFSTSDIFSMTTFLAFREALVRKGVHLASQIMV